MFTRSLPQFFSRSLFFSPYKHLPSSTNDFLNRYELKLLKQRPSKMFSTKTFTLFTRQTIFSKPSRLKVCNVNETFCYFTVEKLNQFTPNEHTQKQIVLLQRFSYDRFGAQFVFDSFTACSKNLIRETRGTCGDMHVFKTRLRGFFFL